MKALLTLAEVAELMRTTPASLHQQRYRGHGPPGFKVGGRLLFDPDELREWLEEHREPDRNGDGS